MPRGPAKFRSTVVKPYLTEQPDQAEDQELPEEEPRIVRRGRGRPRGSRNVQRAENQEIHRSGRHLTTDFDDQFIAAMGEDEISMTKEQADMELSLIIALAPSLLRLKIKLFLRDITQAYTQSTTMPNRLILAHLATPIPSRYYHDRTKAIVWNPRGRNPFVGHILQAS
jgi:hypothetical protein